MFSLLRQHTKRNPDQKFLRKSIIKKAFLRSKRGDQRNTIKRLAKLKDSKNN
jgi:hypothetical protein